MFNTVEEAKRHIEANWTKWDVPTSPSVRRQLAIGVVVSNMTGGELLLVGGRETARLTKIVKEEYDIDVYDLPVCACGNYWNRIIECTCDVDTLKTCANDIGWHVAVHNVGVTVCYTIDEDDMMEWLAAQSEYQRFDGTAREIMEKAVRVGVASPSRLKAILDTCDIMAEKDIIKASNIAEVLQYESNLIKVRQMEVIE